MKRLAFPLMFFVLLSGCLFGGGKAGSGDFDPTAWDGNAQDWYFLDEIRSDEFVLDADYCEADSLWNPVPIRYRLRGDSLDLGWLFLMPNEENEQLLDTFRLGGTYVRDGVGTTVSGGWTLVEHRAWDPGAAASTQVQDLLERWGFLYADERLHVSSRLLLFGYPRFWTWETRTAEFDHGNDSTVTFQYVGPDSLKITRDGETASLRYRMFRDFGARSSRSDRSIISVSLVDRCTYAATVIDTTWVREVLWGLDNTADALGKRRSFSRRLFPRR